MKNGAEAAENAEIAEKNIEEVCPSIHPPLRRVCN
jgi:hypothetical protein